MKVRATCLHPPDCEQPGTLRLRELGPRWLLSVTQLIDVAQNLRHPAKSHIHRVLFEKVIEIDSKPNSYALNNDSYITFAQKQNI